MNKLAESLKLFNAFFTKTTDDENEVYRDIDTFHVNTEGCISLYDLISNFNKMHTAFKKEYESLEKFELGENIEIGRFNKTIDKNGEKNRYLQIYIDNPNFTKEDEVELHILEKTGEICAIKTLINGAYSFGQEVKIDSVKAIKYLDLFEKYELLMELYYRLRNDLLYSHGAFSLYTNIESYKRRQFTETLKSFKVCLDRTYMNYPGDHIGITVNLGKELSIDLDNSEIDLVNEIIPASKDEYFNILKTIYINGQFLENIFSEKKEEAKIKYLIDNK